MKKSGLYKVGALCLTFLGAGTFMAFDDAQTDEQKVETAYQEMVTTFKMEQDQLCKTQALVAAQAHWTALQAENATTGTTVTTTTGGSSSKGTTTTTTTTGGSDQSTTTPVTTTKDPQKDRGGVVSDGDKAAAQKKRGGTVTDGDKAAAQKKRGGK
jgi:hypothetical protein